MPYADRVGLGQPLHQHRLTWELHCLFCQIGLHLRISRSGCAVWSAHTLSAYGTWQISPVADLRLNLSVLHIWAASCKNGSSDTCGQCSSRSACASVQSDLTATLSVRGPIRPYLHKSGQCSSQIRLRGCAGWAGATLSAYVRIFLSAWRGSYYDLLRCGN